MEKQLSQAGPLAEQDRKKFAHQAGLSIDQLKYLESQPTTRSRRQRKDPIFTDNYPKTHSHETKPQLHRSPATSTSRHQALSPTTPKKQPRPPSQTTPKVLRTPQVKHSKDLISVPKSVDEFYQNYITFSSRLFKDSDKEAVFAETHKKELFELFDRVVEEGGIVKVISQGYKNQVFQPFLQRFKATTTDEIFSIYKRFLLHFEYQILQNYTFRQYHNPVPLFSQAVFVDEHELCNFLDKTPLDPKYFDYDIMVFRNGQNAIHINSNSIHLDRVAQHYKNYNIDIRIQKAMDYGFKPRTMRNEPYQMKIGHYRLYQKLCEEYALTQTSIDQTFIDRLGEVKNLDVNGTTFKDRISSEEIFFGVNFDPDDGLLFDEINEKVDGTFLGFKQEFDLLSYLDQQVPGCSFPQFYFKVKGVWTGGHQENINMCSVNINHGPDASEWYSMEFKYVEQFRAQLKKEQKMDLYGSEGLWYEKINWFMEQGKYPVKKIIQKKGDIVVSGPGTLHWVRSHGIALQSAWNQFPITLRMMEYAFCRQEENERINFIRSNTIPLKILTLKLLNHQPPQLTAQIRKLCVEKVKMWMQREEQLFEEFYEESEEFSSEQPRYEKLDDLQGFCTKCRQEILIYFVNGKKVEDILCLNCYKKEYKNKKKTKRVYLRNNLFDLNLLIKKSESGKPFNQIKAFISQYVGKVPLLKKDYKMDKQSVLIEKINTMNKQLNKCDSKKIAEYNQKFKNKRIQSEEKEQQMPFMLEKQEHMDLQPSKEHENCKQSKIVQQKPIKNDFKTMINNVNYIGERSDIGWRSFQIPENLRIVTQQNHVELLKLIIDEELTVLRTMRMRGQPKIIYPYYVVRCKQYWDNRNNFIAYPPRNSKYSDDPKFSSDQDGQEDKIKKKVHKNEDVDQDLHKKDTNKHYHEKNSKTFPKPHETSQYQKRKDARSDSSQSKKSRRKEKPKKKRQSRSKSHQKQRKQRKKNRSRSSKSSKKSNSKHSQKNRSPSGNRRSKSRGKSSRQQSNRGEQQRFKNNKHYQREDFRSNEGRDRNYHGSNRDYQRDGNKEYNNEGNQRQDRRKDHGGRYDRRDNNWNNNRSEKFGNQRRDNWRSDRNDNKNNNNWSNQNSSYRDSRNNMNSNNQWNNSTNNYSNNRNTFDNRSESQRNNNYERRDNYDGDDRGNNYRGSREDQGADYCNSRRYDHPNNDNSRPLNSKNNRYSSNRQDRLQNQNWRQQEDRKASEDQIQNQSDKIVEEKHQNNDFDY